LNGKLSVSMGRTIFRDIKSNYAPVWTISQNITAVPWKLKVPTQFQILKRKRYSKAYWTSTRKVKHLVKPSFKLSWEPLIFQQNIYRNKDSSTMLKVLLGLKIHAGCIFFASSQCFWIALTLQKKRLHKGIFLFQQNNRTSNYNTIGNNTADI
jgi:hypothetical protein